MKLLIDECLSPDLAKAAVAASHQGSTHVTWIGLGGAKDWTVARRAVDEGCRWSDNQPKSRRCFRPRMPLPEPSYSPRLRRLLHQHQFGSRRHHPISRASALRRGRR